MNGILRGVLILALVSPVAPAWAAEAQDASALMEMMVGSFRTAAADALPEGENPFWDRRQIVSLESMGKVAIYWQLNTGVDDRLYRQRLLTFVDNEDGSVTQVTWVLATPEAAADQFQNAAFWAAITPEQLQQGLPEGCEQIWHWRDGAWEGRVNPDRCRIWSERRQQWRRIGAEARLLPDALWQSERGFADDMNQVFGTPPGEYHVLKREAPAP